MPIGNFSFIIYRYFELYCHYLILRIDYLYSYSLLLSVKVEQKLPLFYLLNDVVQHSKRKDLKEFIERFESVLKEAIPHLKDESHVGKVRRVINIWEERQVSYE